MVDVIDLSDLVQSVRFKFNDQECEIPPIPDDKLRGIMNIANKITESSKDGLNDEKTNDEFISNQNKFLAMAIQKKDGKSYAKMDESDFAAWPLKLKNRVMELVFEQIGTSSGEDITAESEKN